MSANDNRVVQQAEDIATIKQIVLNLEKRLNGYVPDQCIRTSQRLAEIERTLERHALPWRTAGLALIAALVGGLSSKLVGLIF